MHLSRSQVFPPIPSHSLPNFFSLVQRDLSLAMDPSHITKHITITWKKKEKHRKHTRNQEGRKITLGWKMFPKGKEYVLGLKIDNSWKRHSMKANDERERQIWIAGNRLEVNNYTARVWEVALQASHWSNGDKWLVFPGEEQELGTSNIASSSLMRHNFHWKKGHDFYQTTTPFQEMFF